MTAIKPGDDGRKACEVVSVGDDIRRKSHRCSPGKNARNESNKSKRSSTVFAARERFAGAVSRGVDELTSWYGYSRERAAELLLGEIRKDDSPPCDDEVFQVMERCRLGMEEAAKTVTVARALRRSRVEKGLSAVEAIDDLTSKLRISSLVMKVEATSCSPDKSGHCSGTADRGEGTLEVQTKHVSAETGENGGGMHSVASRSMTSAQRTAKCTKSTFGRSIVSKAAVRKRPLPGCDDNLSNSTIVDKELQAADELEMGKKAKLSEKQETLPDASIRCKSPTGSTVRTKRGAMHRGEEQQLFAQQPALKRPRADSEL
mmetsp:Transcript_2050/g.5403  ORF Transcript_2050/g.5403 Transcript_2050/m.5403 type:complete len:317 (-) Transcript_2050:362-1312(-)|eukprot:CAMPEP_0113544150 /NCGR_PEP_ID=MMETSP0015_2-20120614/10552_1 /TAXON_ID=2838 /ORGANISM="Odontella" /LENGTH=316 /DNA_ID=CAMNT_0000444385 /DNA_START=250 /DNA_END=1200 /DNA_ORIENTATION=+ /assembly_acc=CAM_ASM_000160